MTSMFPDIVPAHKLHTSQRDSAALKQEEASRLEKYLYLWARSEEGSVNSLKLGYRAVRMSVRRLYMHIVDTL